MRRPDRGVRRGVLEPTPNRRLRDPPSKADHAPLREDPRRGGPLLRQVGPLAPMGPGRPVPPGRGRFPEQPGLGPIRKPHHGSTNPSLRSRAKGSPRTENLSPVRPEPVEGHQQAPVEFSDRLLERSANRSAELGMGRRWPGQTSSAGRCTPGGALTVPLRASYTGFAWQAGG